MVVVGAVLEVHAEGGVHVAQVMVVVQLGEGLVGQLSLAVETLKEVIA